MRGHVTAWLRKMEIVKTGPTSHFRPEAFTDRAHARITDHEERK